jgi:hypothetical protein
MLKNTSLELCYYVNNLWPTNNNINYRNIIGLNSVNAVHKNMYPQMLPAEAHICLCASDQ